MDSVKRMKITPDMWDFILDFISEHPEMATGKFTGPNAKQQNQKLWNELAEKLNGLGYGSKTPAKWQKSFSDWKYNIKQKYAAMKIHRSATGGGPSLEKKLTPQEERLMGLIGKSFIEGDGAVDEIGLRRQIPETYIESLPSTSREVPKIPEPEIPEEEIIFVDEISVHAPPSEPSSYISAGVSESLPPSRLSTSAAPSPSTSFVSRPQSRTRDLPRLERFQEETMDVLQNINENLTNILSNIERLTEALILYLNRDN